MALLDESHYVRIRRAISQSFNEVTLSDDVIRDSGVVDEAEDWTARQTADTGEHAVRAARYYAAHLLVPSVWGQLQAAHNIVGGDGTAVKWRELAAELLRRAESEIAAIAGEAAPERRPMQSTGSVRVNVTF
jgi:hypothetical protein